ncbi:hypothetical protein RBU49_12705 [Clostridium sp. MB40-C1]|uniref:hypothetical protein n=1 Tax=Clostridium sp. MB40-C1 TaxID=3070996 RepID=UPI0027DF1F1E|nr:hypothetical protein [Clostridium sp. MB40-C1]WMJ79722.1 hypothetical protein RBU49_12705 [Clostridium sp. MB40-C1]
MKKKKLLVSSLIVIAILIICTFLFNHKLNTKTDSVLNTNKNIPNSTPKKPEIFIPKEALNHDSPSLSSESKDLRKFPYPYKSMLSICSDIDDATIEEFKLYHKFLNTQEDTPYGKGIGLDIGDSFWMYMADDMNFKVDKENHGVDHIMTFFKGIDPTKKYKADEIINYINCGWIDSIHSFGDFSTNTEKNTKFQRDLAIKALEALKNSNSNVSVWINHGNRANKQNFGSGDLSEFMSYQEGDKKDSNYYHTDLTLKNNIKYVWNSLNDTTFGFDYPLFQINLRDGQKVWGFSRHTNYIKDKKIDWTWTPKHLHRQLTKNNLDNIVNKNQYSIVAQHFGVSTEDLFEKKNINALKRLKNYQDNGKILITKTSRLLNYANVQKHLVYKKINLNNKMYINILSVKDPIFGTYIPTLNDIKGITFYCENPNNTILLLNDKVIPAENIQKNHKDKHGKKSISLKWFNFDYKDYTKQ